MKVSESFNLFDFNYNSMDDSKINQLVDLMKKKYHSIKKNYSPYLDSTRKNPLRRALTRKTSS